MDSGNIRGGWPGYRGGGPRGYHGGRGQPFYPRGGPDSGNRRGGPCDNRGGRGQPFYSRGGLDSGNRRSGWLDYRGGDPSDYRGGRGQPSYPSGGRGGWQRSPAVEVATTPPPPLGPMIRKLAGKDLEADADKLKHVATVSNDVLLASYNWLGGKVPTIVVPGLPARWTPLAELKEIPDDNGNYGSRSSPSTREAFRDENAARFPKHPMEPAIVATLQMFPDLLESEHRPDVVACGSTLGSLLRFVCSDNKPFRMLVEAVGDAVFLVRRENSPTELIPNIQGYGHSFPEHYTTWEADVKGSRSHQRVMRYRFGGLRFLVRFEGDGYIAAAGESPAKTTNTPEPASLDEVLDSLQATGVSDAKTAVDAGLKVESAGQLVDQAQVFELKTRSIKKVDQDTLGEQIPRLWVRRISKFILAFHERGIFNDIRIMDVEEKVKEWEAVNNEALAKLAALLHCITDLVRARSDGKLEICHFGSGVLEIREQRADAGNALSAEIKAQWTAGLESDEVTEQETVEEEQEDEKDDDLGLGWGSDDDGPGDFTACSSESCGYCGRCTY